MPRPRAAGVLGALSIVLRVCAWLLVALVVANALFPAGPRAALLALNGLVSHLVPGFIQGLFVFQTPFEGAFRGDYAIVAIVLLVLDWICCRISASLR